MKLTVQKFNGVTSFSTRGYGHIDLAVEMSEAQMLQAIDEFQTQISGETWGRWLEEWNKEEA